MATNRIFAPLGSNQRIIRAASNPFCKLLYAPVESLTGEIMVRQTGTPNLGDVAWQIPISTWFAAAIPNFKKAYQESQENSDAGPAMKYTVSAFVPFDSETNHKLFDRMKYHRYLLLLYTPQKMIKLLGSAENPVRFSHSFEAQFNGTIGTSIQFTWSNADKPLLYKGEGIIPGGGPGTGGETDGGGSSGGISSGS